MTADGSLYGLVLDVRKNPGGSTVGALPVLGLFTGGSQGAFVSAEGSEPLVATPEEVGGSQWVPLAVLADEDTVSFGELFAGVLQRSGRASVVGAPTPGNVEVLYGYGFIDGSVAWLAHAQFEPVGLEPGAWEGVGIQPDVPAPGSWELFGEADDPALAAAVELLQTP
jgi:carboxyl-terminal processing protease